MAVTVITLYLVVSRFNGHESMWQIAKTANASLLKQQFGYPFMKHILEKS
jgi:hypothetical protein